MTITTNPLDALLAIRNGYPSARWNFPDAVGTPVSSPGGIGNAAEVTFSFLTAIPPYFSTTGFAQFSELQKQAARNVLASIANVARVSFTEVPGIGAMTIAMNAQSGSAGYAYYPTHGYYSYSGTITSTYAADVAGDVWLNSDIGWTATDFAAGGSGYGTLVHEAGHALGLKHPFFEADAPDDYILDTSLDNQKYTVMSYTEHPYNLYRTVTETSTGYTWRYEYIQPETLMPLDIAALQYLYGANLGYRTGNDTYTFDAGRPFIQTIWDGGGTDTISVANFSRGCVIDLRDGYYSSISIPSDPLPPGYTENNPGIYDGTDNLAIASGAIIENATGGAGADQLIGNGAANILKGGGGADTMTGGAGNDTYYVANPGDVVTELSGEGADLVYSSLGAYTLGANVENGRILAAGVADLTGNSLNNLLYAGAGNNVLDGGTGTDTLSYATATAGVTVNLALTAAQATVGSGADTISGFENLTGSNHADTLTGNAGANTISGGAGNDIINGGLGLDTMIGGTGNDTYRVNATGDVTRETSTVATEIDTVISTVNRTLGNYLERLTLSGAAAINGTGNALANTLTGNGAANILKGGAGNDILNGGLGNDTLTGGAGYDSFLFSTALNASTNKDTITDFVATDDTIRLENAIFTSLITPTTLFAANFRASTEGTALEADDYVLYETDSGALRYDADGRGAGPAIQFATLTTHPALTNMDFIVV